MVNVVFWINTVSFPILISWLHCKQCQHTSKCLHALVLTAMAFASHTWSTFFQQCGVSRVSRAAISAFPSNCSFSKRPLKPIRSIWPGVRTSSLPLAAELVFTLVAWSPVSSVTNSAGLNSSTSNLFRISATICWALWWGDCWQINTKLSKKKFWEDLIYLHSSRYFFSLVNSITT